ncbi:MAG: type II toxin-antitoxin system HicB family antitoxin [Synergistaceae bacterium]|nr:type II toxin-antitoxin system HicB family antitoxin [Synergistaceae bacterium]
MKYVFPAVINYSSSDQVYYVDFPDTENYFGCYTYGQDLYEALNHAEDALNLALWYEEDNKRPIPQASDIKDIAARAPAGSIVTLIKADTEEYAKKLRQGHEEELAEKIA